MTRPLNTGIPALSSGNSTTIPGMSLSGNLITVPIGSYTVRAEAGGIMGLMKARLIDDGSPPNVLAYGTSVGDSTNTAYSTIDQEIVFVSSTNVQLQFYGTTATNTSDWGAPVSSGDPEVYARISFMKLV